MALDPVTGKLIGTGVGALVDIWNDEQERKYDKEQAQAKRDAVERARRQAAGDYSAMEQILTDFNTNRTKLADDDMVKQYLDIIKTYNPQVYEFGKFGDQYNKNVDDFLNPQAEKIAELAGLKTQAEMAGRGAAKGTGALAGIGYSRWEAADKLYREAQQALKDDRSQAYTEYSDYIKNMQNKLNQISENTLSKAKLLGGAVESETQAQSDYISDLLGIMGDKASTNVNATIGAF